MAVTQIFAKNLQKHCSVWIPTVSSVRNALYPASKFLTPIPDRELLDRLEAEGKLEDFKAMPVAPAPPFVTNSVFDDPEVRTFTNLLMKWSNKEQARQLMHDVFARIKRIQLKKYHAAPPEERADIVTDPKKVFYVALENCRPTLSVLPIKKGGITYQVPTPIETRKKRYMSMKWLIAAGRDKDGPISFVEQMTKELLDAFHHEGRVIKRKHDLHKLCENNKAYAHYRWS